MDNMSDDRRKYYHVKMSTIQNSLHIPISKINFGICMWNTRINYQVYSLLYKDN